MNKNASRIRSGIRALTDRPFEIVSGKVVPGSVDMSGYTISIQPSDDGEPIEGVMLSTVTGNGHGTILIPKDDSNVIVGTVDGPGVWTIIKASELTKAIISIEGVQYEMDNTLVSINIGNVTFNVGTSVFKMSAGSESLYGILHDLLTGLTVLTVDVSSVASTVPVNVSTFSDLLTRLNNLLSA